MQNLKSFFKNFFKNKRNIYFSLGILVLLIIVLLVYLYIPHDKRFWTSTEIKTVSDINPVDVFRNGVFSNVDYDQYKLYINGNLEYQSRTGTTAKYKLAMENENFIISYSKKPDFEIVKGGSYSNSGNSIIFTTGNLELLFHNNVNLGGNYFYSGVTLEIQNSYLLPRFYAFSYELGENIINFESGDFDTDLWTGGTIVLHGYQRQKNDIQNLAFIGKSDKKIDGQNEIFMKDFASGNEVQKNIFSGERTSFSGNYYYNAVLNIDKQYRSGTDYVIKYSNLPKNGKFILGLDDGYEINVLHFNTFKDIAVNVNKNMMQTKFKLNNYHICISQPIDQKNTLKNLENALGSGNFSVVFSKTDSDYDEKQLGNNCMMFWYYVDPDKDNNYDINVPSLFGDSAKVKVNIPKYEIPQEDKIISVIGDKINLLPKNGYWGDKIQLGIRNYKNASIQIRECKLDFDNFINIILSKEGSQNDDYKYYENRGVLQYLINCDNTGNKFDFELTGYKARKPQIYNLPILQVAKNDNLNIFQVAAGQTGFNKITRYNNTYIRTNIGLLAKRSGNKYQIFGNYLDSGKFFTGGVLEIYKLKDVKQGEKFEKSVYSDFSGNIEIDLNDMKIGFVVLRKDNDFAVIGLSVGGWVNYGNNYDGAQNDSYFYKYYSSNYYYNGDYTEPEQTRTVKVYGYSDRALYKPGDTVFVAGWVRNMLLKDGKIDKSYIPTGNITVSLNHNGQISSQTISKVDEFGGFDTMFDLPKSVELGDYEIKLSFSTGSDQTYDYSFYIRVDEYKKSSFYLDTSYVQDEEMNKYFRISPKYYFGGNLKDFDYWIDYSFIGNQYGYYSRDLCGSSNCDEPYFFNKSWGSDGNMSAYISGTAQDHIDMVLQSDKSAMIGTQTFSIKIKDDVSKEIKTKIIDQKVLPQYLVGLKGRDWDYANSSDKTLKISGKVMNLKNGIADQNLNVLGNYSALTVGKAKIQIYFNDYSSNQEKGVDGNYYYVNGTTFKKIKEDEVNIQNGDFSYDLDISQNGQYDVKVIYDDKYIVEKMIDSYDYSNGSYNFFGKMFNNMELKVNINDKKYVGGDEVQIDLDPYIKGAYAILTLEQGEDILETRTFALDEDPIKIKVKDERAPNVYANVVVIVGENINKNVSPIRQEPRILAGQGEINIDSDINKLDYSLKITDENGKSQSYYQPGQKINLQINVKDHNGNPVKTRISVGIVDKALIDIYDILRKPMDYFYNRWGDYTDTFMNYHFLYQALEVFMASGEKGGDGGMPSTMINLRKKFLDVAFWTGGAITDDNGDISLQTTMPDNLTTWVIDIIGITKDLKLGTYRQQFQTKKDIFIQPNLPNFVSVGDKIQIPVQLFKNINSNNFDIKGYAQLSGQKIDMDSIKILQDGSRILELDMSKFSDESILNSENITLYINASNGDKIYDEVEVNIPLRNEGYRLSKFLYNLGKKFDSEIKLDDSSKSVNIQIGISKIPIDGFVKAMKYLIHYPYGCSEQLLSGIYPIVLANDLSKDGFVGQDIIKDSSVNIDGNYQNIKDVIDSALVKLYANQAENGQMGYWEGGQSPSDGLSVYVFGVMKFLQNKGYSVKGDYLKKLENYINTIKDNDLLMYYYYFKSLYDKTANAKLVSERMNSSDISKILGYCALVNINPKYSNLSLESEIDGILKQSKDYKTDRYWTYFDTDILKSFYLKALIKSGKISKAAEYTNELLKSRDNEGKWGWSTQKNLQIISALGDYINATKNIKDIKYKFKIGDKEFDGTITKEKPFVNIDYVLQNISKFDVFFSSDEDLILDINAVYIPDDLSKIKDSMQNVSSFDLGLIPGTGENTDSEISQNISKLNIGDFAKFKGSFKTSQDASQVAVIFQIPSNIQLLNPKLNGQQNDGELYGVDAFYYSAPSKDDALYFEETDIGTGNWYSCNPDHYEVRFDRLFLYYDKLNANKGCNVYFKGIKTHDGQTNIMPSKLWEMYKTNVSAQKIIK